MISLQVIAVLKKTLLVLELTLCELERVLFTDEENSQNYPAHIQNSKLTIADWDKVQVGCQQLLNSVHIQDEETPKLDGGVNAKAGDSTMWELIVAAPSL